MPARLVDTHAHVQSDAFDGDRKEVMGRALDTLEWLVVVGDTIAASRAGMALCSPRVFATVGVHPHHAAETNPGTWDELRPLLNSPGVVALGEMGLDYHYDFSPREDQRAAFETQLAMACEANVPVVIHCREAEADLSAILIPFVDSLPGGIMHCFGGDAAFAEQCLAWGLHISFAGNVTFPKAENLRDAARVVPLDRLLVETDCPYLAPKPVRGKRCEPAFVAHTAAFLAELKGVPLEEFTRATTRNAHQVYRVPPIAEEA